ncbi:hypothetical protein TYRP_012987 [Tyrophagus putrescentiae]|nr:hypothetical protein TYRP_012987 [Tyrophagus putrescentiae]
MEKKDSTSKLDQKTEKLGLETSISSQPTNHIEDGNDRWRQMSFDDNDHSGPCTDKYGYLTCCPCFWRWLDMCFS